MKWIALLLLLMLTPLIAAWLRTSPRKAYLAWALLGLLPFVLGPWHLLIAPYATPMWSGYVKGWEVSLLDALALAIIVGTRGERWPRLTLLGPLLAYLLAVALAVTQAKFGTLAWAYVIQLIRMTLVFVAVTRVVVSERGERAVLTGMILGLTIQAVYALLARAGGALQTGGSLGHQNLLGFMSHMVVMPALAMVLAGRWQKIGILGVVTGAIAVILTASRGTIAFGAAGVVLTLILSMAMSISSRKIAFGVIGVAFLAASVPFANAALQRRFEVQRSSFFSEDQEREAFERAAKSMLAAKPMGVGPNHYVFIANTEGYSARAGVNWRSQSRATNVHNTYLLVAAETGYLGLITFVTLLGSAIWLAFSTAFRFRRQPGSEILIGVGCAFLAVTAHSLYEWMFVVYPSQYLVACVMGIIVGMRSRFIRAEQVDKAGNHPAVDQQWAFPTVSQPA